MLKAGLVREAEVEILGILIVIGNFYKRYLTKKAGGPGLMFLNLDNPI